MRVALGTLLAAGVLLAGGIVPAEAAGPPRYREIAEAGDAAPRADVALLGVSYAGIWEPDPHGVTVDKATRVRRGDRVTVWIDTDRDRRPEGRIDHVVGRDVVFRAVGTWRGRGRVLDRDDCTEEEQHPDIFRRSWSLAFHAWCFDGFGHGALGQRWRVSVRVVSGGAVDHVPARRSWTAPLRNRS